MKNRAFLSYFCCGLLFFMWQTSHSLAASAHPRFGYGAAPAFAEIIFVLHYLAGGVGLLLSGLLCDKVITTGRVRRLFAVLLTVAAFALTALQLVVRAPVVYLSLCVAAALFGFGANAVLLGGLFRRVSYSMRPLCYGLSFSAATLLRLPIDLYRQNGGASPYAAYLGFGLAGLALLCGLLLSKPIQAALEDPERIGREPGVQPQAAGNFRLFIMAVACSVVVYVLFGVFDNLVGETPVVTNHILYVRLIQIAVPGIAGVVCYKWGHYAAVLCSVSLLGIGTLAYSFSYSGPGGILCAVANVAGFNFFLGPTRALFADLAQRSKLPYTVTSLGFATYFLWQVVGVPVAGLMRRLGGSGGMVFYLALFMLAVPVIMVFFHMLRSVHTAAAGFLPMPAQKRDDSSESAVSLTRREREILDMVLTGKLSKEIAETLFVSESTVNWHVGNILKKTGIESRAKLVERYRERD